MDFHTRLFQCRKKSGLSQEELADRLEVTRQTISKWETGETTPDMDKLIALAELFSLSLDELILGKTPAESRLDSLTEKVMTEENKKKFHTGLKWAGIIAAIVFAADLISMGIYFLLFGLPA